MSATFLVPRGRVPISTLCARPAYGQTVHTNVLTSAHEDYILSQSWRAMRLEWDEQKNRLNLRKHAVRFETAVLVFDDPHAITQRGVTFEDEDRWITVGGIGAGFDSIGRSYFL